MRNTSPCFYLPLSLCLSSGCPDLGRRDWQRQALRAADPDRPKMSGQGVVTLMETQ